MKQKKDRYPLILTEYYGRIAKEWVLVSRSIVRAFAGAYPERADIADKLVLFLENPGKFMRPSLFLFGYSFGGEKIDRRVVRLAVSFELLHTYFLVHDDIMDKSDMRRSVKSLHRLFEDYHRGKKFLGSSEYYGISMAILLGDLLAKKADEMWTDAIASGAATNECRSLFEDVIEETIWGQHLDIVTSNEKTFPKREIIIAVMESKTSKYSIWRPLQIGMRVGGLPEPKWLKRFSINLGIAYQIADDILGSFGDEKVTGKSADSDIVERKRTLIALKALESKKYGSRLSKYYLTDSGSGDNAYTIRQIFSELGVEAEVRKEADVFASRALSVIDRTNIPDQKKDMIREFSKFVVHRNK